MNSASSIWIEQNVDHVAPGGTVIGMLSAIGDRHSLIGRSKPPSLDSVHHYLGRAVTAGASDEEPSFKKGEKDKERYLWDQRFHGRRPGQASSNPKDLYLLVKDIFIRDSDLGRMQRAVILAESGMGKTPALKYLRRERAKDSIVYYNRYWGQMKDEPEPPPPKPEKLIVPLLIPLGALLSGQTFLELVRNTYSSLCTEDRFKIGYDQARGLLGEYRCLFLLDDLNELTSTRHTGAIHLLSHIMQTFQNRNHQYVITCCRSAYAEQLGPLDEVTLCDLFPDQVNKVLGQDFSWLSADLRALAQNRFMLKLILDLSQETLKKRENERRFSKGHLLQRKLRSDLEKIRAEGSRPIGYGEMAEGLLETLSFAMQRSRTHTFSEHQVMEIVTDYLNEWHESHQWREVVAALSDAPRVLKRDELRQWSFETKAMETYLAAGHLLQHPAALRQVLEEGPDRRWRDVLEILAGLQPDPSDLLVELIDRDVLTAAHCIGSTAATTGEWLVEALINALIQRLSLESSERRARIVARIVDSKHPHATEALLHVLDVDWSSMVLKATASAIWKWDKDDGKMHCRCPETEFTKALLERYSALNGSSESDLKELANNEAVAEQIRGVSAILLGLTGTPTARQALLELLRNRKVKPKVSWCAVEALTDDKDDEVRETAIGLYKGEKYQTWDEGRARGVYLLGWVSKPEKGDVKVLTGALDDSSTEVRRYAINALARLRLPDSRTEIERAMKGRDEPALIREAAQALCLIGTTASIESLERHLRHREARTRRAVRKAIDKIRDGNVVGRVE